MEKDVVISIKGRQAYPGVDPEVIELVTAGKLAWEGSGDITLSYQESEVTGLEGTLTTIQVEPARVTLMRMGSVNAQMVFEEGRRHMSLYETPYGSLCVGVHTRRLRSTLNENGGQVTVHYALEIQHGAVGQSLFQISVRDATPWEIPQ